MQSENVGTRANAQDLAQRGPKVTRQGLVEAIGLLVAHLPENLLYGLWKMLSNPPSQLKRAQLMIANYPESADLFYDAVRLDRIIRYLDARFEGGVLEDVDHAEAKEGVRKTMQEFEKRMGMAITILRTQLGELSHEFGLSLRGLDRLGGFDKAKAEPKPPEGVQ